MPVPIYWSQRVRQMVEVSNGHKYPGKGRSGHRSGGGAPLREIGERLRVGTLQTPQRGSVFTDPGVFPRVLWGDPAGEIQGLEGAIRASGPQLGSGQFDVEPGASLGRKIGRWHPVARDGEGTADMVVSQADGEGYLVD